MPMTFGEAMLSIIKKRKLSATAIAEDLGFKSRTAFFRILHDESRIPAIKRCYEAAEGSSLLSLDENEKALLRESIHVSELGKKEYGISSVLHQMVYPAAPIPDDEINFSIEGAGEYDTLEKLLLQMKGMKTATIVILGRCSKRLMDRLYRLTKEAPIRKIVHLFALDEDSVEDIKVFSEMSNLLFSDAYSVYFLNETGANQKFWWLRSGIILFSFEENDGKKRAWQLSWLGEDSYLFSEESQPKLKGYWNCMIRNIRDQMVSFKLEPESDSQPDIQQYIDFTRHYQKLEQNREIYTIRPDFPMNCIPVEILAPPIIDAFAQLCPEGADDFRDRISMLYDIHKSRVDNFFNKRKATHIILNVDAMKQFAVTGSRSDHFFSTRPYTPEERVKTLTILRDQALNNPNFNIWMTDHPEIVSDRELTIYEGYGVALVKGDTSWRLDHDHQEVMLESKMLAQYFKSYFMRSVIASAVMTKEESIALLNQMIDIAKRA